MFKHLNMRALLKSLRLQFKLIVWLLSAHPSGKNSALQRALAKVLVAKRCQTRRLTCARCLRYAVQRPDLPQLESGPHFMTAVRVHVDHTGRKYDRWHNPEGSARVHAWAYSSGHCRISHRVSLWIADCSLTANCVTVLKIDGTQVQWSDDEFKHLTNVSVWFSHYWLGWVWAPHSRGLGSSLGQRKSGVGSRQCVPRSTLCSGRLSACLFPKPCAHTPPFLFTSAKCPD